MYGAHKLCVSIDVLESQSNTVFSSCTPSTASMDTHDTHTPPQHVTWTGPSRHSKLFTVNFDARPRSQLSHFHLSTNVCLASHPFRSLHKTQIPVAHISINVLLYAPPSFFRSPQIFSKNISTKELHKSLSLAPFDICYYRRHSKLPQRFLVQYYRCI